MRGGLGKISRPPATRSRKDSLISHSVAQTQAFSRHYRHFPGLFCAALLLWQLPAGAEPVELRSDSRVATAGFFQLTWQAEGEVVVQEATTAEFLSPRVVYRGSDSARVMSGKPDGDWYYRARTAGSASDYGQVLKVTVQHHSVARAFGFFALGAVVFLVTLGVIINGARSK